MLETGILAKGEMEFAAKYEGPSTARRAQLISTEAHLKYEKSAANLQIQESRLNRHIEKDKAELLRLQTIRRREELLAAEAANAAVNHPNRSNGFDICAPGKSG